MLFEDQPKDRFSATDRKRPRLNVDIVGEYLLGKHKDYVECRILDLAEEGLGIKVKSFLDKGEKIKIRFVLAEKKLEFEALVVVVRGSIIGLRYCDISANDINFISSHINNNFFNNFKNKK